jgi:Catechol dioxygenase N terminus
MRDFDENNITAAVIERYQNTPDPRLKKIMTSLVQHLHDFVRDVEPTEAEWGQAIDFPHPHRQAVHRQAAGVHSAVRHARRFHAGGRH